MNGPRRQCQGVQKEVAGWSVAKHGLVFERNSLGNPQKREKSGIALFERQTFLKPRTVGVMQGSKSDGMTYRVAETIKKFTRGCREVSFWSCLLFLSHPVYFKLKVLCEICSVPRSVDAVSEKLLCLRCFRCEKAPFAWHRFVIGPVRV